MRRRKSVDCLTKSRTISIKTWRLNHQKWEIDVLRKDFLCCSMDQWMSNDEKNGFLFSLIDSVGKWHGEKKSWNFSLWNVDGILLIMFHESFKLFSLRDNLSFSCSQKPYNTIFVNLSSLTNLPHFFEDANL